MIRSVLNPLMRISGGWRATRALTGSSPRIFMFHRFGLSRSESRIDADGLKIFLERVREQCDIVRMHDLIEGDIGRRARNRPLAVITVDDGYHDFYDIAAPVLLDLKVTATVYVTGGFIDRQCWLWWDALRYLVDNLKRGPLRLDLGGRAIVYDVSDSRTRDLIWRELADLLVRNNYMRGRVLSSLEEYVGEKLPQQPIQEYQAMTWTQLDELLAEGFEVGGHTMTHPFLPGLSNNELTVEIAGGKRLIEEKLRTKLTTFAYTNGQHYDYSHRVEGAIRAAGFKAAVLAWPRPYRSKHRFVIGRWSVSPESESLEYVLNGASILRMEAAQILRRSQASA